MCRLDLSQLSSQSTVVSEQSVPGDFGSHPSRIRVSELNVVEKDCSNDRAFQGCMGFIGNILAYICIYWHYPCQRGHTQTSINLNRPQAFSTKRPVERFRSSTLNLQLFWLQAGDIVMFSHGLGRSSKPPSKSPSKPPSKPSSKTPSKDRIYRI